MNLPSSESSLFGCAGLYLRRGRLWDRAASADKSDLDLKEYPALKTWVKFQHVVRPSVGCHLVRQAPRNIGLCRVTFVFGAKLVVNVENKTFNSGHEKSFENAHEPWGLDIVYDSLAASHRDRKRSLRLQLMVSQIVHKPRSLHVQTNK